MDKVFKPLPGQTIVKMGPKNPIAYDNKGRLVLSRKAGEKIIMKLPNGGEVLMTLTRDTNVILEAPKWVRIARAELEPESPSAA